MTNNVAGALTKVVNSFLEYSFEVKDDKISELFSLALNYHLMNFVKSLKLLAEASGRNSIISLDFYYFVPQILNLLNTSNSLRVVHRDVFTHVNEYKRCAPPPEHAYRFSKSKGLRLDDLFSVRKRKTQQTQQIEVSLIRVIHQGNFNYDA